MILRQFYIDGPGCLSYLVGCEHHGLAMVVDPDRHVDKYLELAEKLDLEIIGVVDTHLHTDHVSGNTELADVTGAEIFLPEAAEATLEHSTLAAGDVLEIGNVRLTVLPTPGHTPESISLVVWDVTRGEEPFAVLTGDTLRVGDVGRPDASHPAELEGLARQLYHSVFHTLAELPDSTIVYPGHATGGSCGKGGGSIRLSTIGYEKRTSPIFSLRDEAAFVEFVTTQLPERPANHDRLRELNRRGAPIVGVVEPEPLPLQDAVHYLARGAALVDTRPKAAFKEKHPHGAVHLELGPTISKRAGYVFYPEETIVLLLDSPEDYETAFWELARVGYDNIVGYLEGGMRTWEAAGFPVAAGDVEDVSPKTAYEIVQNGSHAQFIDVRERWEYRQAHPPGITLIPLGELPSRLNELDPDRPVVIICNSGNRSQTAAGILGQNGFRKVYNVLDGIVGWMQQGLPVEQGDSLQRGNP